jgi:membrane associated rhomboid family serine protease
MLEDREYMREPAYQERWSLTIWLVIVNAVAFVTQKLAYLAFPASFPFESPVDRFFALSLPGLKEGYVWQFVTFQFMHGGIWHLLLNCFAIWMFGRAVEEALGRCSFLVLYFASGVMGGLFQVLAALLVPSQFSGAVVGASAGAFGLTAAFAVLYPNRPLTLLLFFVLPITMRAKYLLLISGLLAVFGLVFRSDNVAHAAHLGGMLTGIVFVRWASHWHWPQLRQPSRRRAQPALVTTHGQRTSPWRPPRVEADDDLSPDEFLSKEVDPILDKISAHGIHSLTERERKILEAARKKMSER